MSTLNNTNNQLVAMQAKFTLPTNKTKTSPDTSS